MKWRVFNAAENPRLTLTATALNVPVKLPLGQERRADLQRQRRRPFHESSFAVDDVELV